MVGEQSASNRRDFLTGRAARKEIEQQLEQSGDVLADALVDSPAVEPPVVGDTLRLETSAMACEFAVVLNAELSGDRDRGELIAAMSSALDLVHRYEQQMTVYRDDSELSKINRRAFAEPVVVDDELFRLLQLAKQIAVETEGAFDPTAGALIALWQECRQAGRIPTADEIAAVRQRMGVEFVELNEADPRESSPENRLPTVRYLRDDLSLNLGGIGKGDALDRIAEAILRSFESFFSESHFSSESSPGHANFLLHGGQSSLLVRGNHSGCDGWPVGLRDPLFPQNNWATLLLKNCAMSSSGSGVQHFRHAGKRYGHLLDPRVGMPAEGALSVTVLAPSAAMADALSTAFFVMGLEKTKDYCDDHAEIGAIFIPPPERGRKLSPVLCNICEQSLFVTGDSE